MLRSVANANAIQQIPAGIVPVMCVVKRTEDRHEAGTEPGGFM